ncbi:MAG: ABC transporter ATP-binding protein/permease [Firmicutes bacterium]|nr:ABC transporter ATP-binding protein/permease [Bacillota bacterium]
MLRLVDLSKEYRLNKSQSVTALKGVDLEFEGQGLVSILGPSGCGKTTLLNIVGGLGGASGGDMIVDDVSTKDYKDRDWDAYRNGTIGFVFQSYNLIPHLTARENVAMSLSLRGVAKAEMLSLASQALESVGLGDQITKKPNQMSNGQMQRVAIARALVGNPKIILADEPTGALDYETSRQVMELLSQIAQTKLVIMVTHNRELATEYSDRIITLRDGVVVSDTYTQNQSTGQSDNPPQNSHCHPSKKTSLRLHTALRLSFKNLLTKKIRTILTSIAGSVGIVGIGLVLAITIATGNQLLETQSNFLAGTPLTITDTTSYMIEGTGNFAPPAQGAFPESDTMYPFDHRDLVAEFHLNYFSEDFMAHLDLLDPNLITNINLARGMTLTAVLRRDNGTYSRLSGQNSIGAMGRIFGTFVELPQSPEFAQHHHPVIFGRYPQAYNEVVLLVDRFNRIERNTLMALGFDYTRNHSFEDIIGRTMRIIPNNDLFVETSSSTPSRPRFSRHPSNMYLYHNSDHLEVRIVGIMRERQGVTPVLPLMGLAFTPSLMDMMLANAQNSEVVRVARRMYYEYNWDILSSPPTPPNTAETGYFNPHPGHGTNFTARLFELGGTTAPRTIQIFYANFDAVDIISDHINAFNYGRPPDEQIFFQNPSAPIIEIIEEALSVITVIFMIMIGISLAVSTIMIGIITYISVMERIKEIGLLRALGARKKDISRIFNAETLIIGFVAGLLGTILTFALSSPINRLIYSLIQVQTSASLPLPFALLLIASSMLLTLIAGLIPAKIAAKKDPVKALRTD